MIKEIVKDPLFLMRKAEPATIEDKSVIQDLKDTLLAQGEERCVGMAANMIGSTKRIIVIYLEGMPVILINPYILKTSGNCYMAQEGCLCHTASHEVKRWEEIKVSYQDEQFKKRIKTFKGFTAEIIQHEIDHCEGMLI